MKRRRGSFTLLELLLSLTLFAMVLSTLFFWYSRLTVQKALDEKTHAEIHLENALHRHLFRVLPKANGKHFSTTPKDAPNVQGESLVFTFDHGPNIEPKLSDTVLGRIYHNPKDNTLCLGIWPWDGEKPIKEPSRKMVLLENITKIEFSFFYPPDLFKKPVDPEAVGHPTPKEGWQNTWQAEFETLPALVKILITKKEEDKPLVFGYCLDPIKHPLILLKGATN